MPVHCKEFVGKLIGKCRRVSDGLNASIADPRGPRLDARSSDLEVAIFAPVEMSQGPSLQDEML